MPEAKPITKEIIQNNIVYAIRQRLRSWFTNYIETNKAE
nr:hypothetical protein [Providencia rettgeri]